MGIDYSYKAKVLASGLCKEVKKHDKDIYKQLEKGSISLLDIPFEDAMFCSANGCDLCDLEEARKINNSSNKRVKRLKDRIERYLSMGCCIWLTLTFTDAVLSKTTEETRKRYVARFLKSQSPYYIANIDYGSTTEREHYHAVVMTDFVDMTKWSYGFAYTERIKNHIKTSTKISKYVSKLCNHAIKETTKRSCYIYSRGQ